MIRRELSAYIIGLFALLKADFYAQEESTSVLYLQAQVKNHLMEVNLAWNASM